MRANGNGLSQYLARLANGVTLYDLGHAPLNDPTLKVSALSPAWLLSGLSACTGPESERNSRQGRWISERSSRRIMRESAGRVSTRHRRSSRRMQRSQVRVRGSRMCGRWSQHARQVEHQANTDIDPRAKQGETLNGFMIRLL